MCGIAAIFAYAPDAPSVDRLELLGIRDHMARRGPDGAGVWIAPDQRTGLAHRRLSIIDTSEAGGQPMSLGEGGLACPACGEKKVGITFNGEIYNYQALRSGLQARGHNFQSQSDTEVLLHLYAEHGADMLHHLRGMYAFTIWDACKRGLFMARDAFGIKPLYYADDGRTIRVASQVKALLQSPCIDQSVDPAGHVGFFLWGSVPDPFTLFQGISGLPAGHWMWVDHAGSHGPREYCSVGKILQSAEADGPRLDNTRSERVAHAVHCGLLRKTLADTVAHHLIADVPVGLFLSGGIDSTTLAAFVAQKDQRIQTVTLGFPEYRNTSADETTIAKSVARWLGLQHQTVWVTRRDFETELETLFETMDCPSVDGVNTYLASLAARRAGLTVALSGIGGDELFGGYPSFEDLPRVTRALGLIRAWPGVGRTARIISASVIRRLTSPKYAGVLEYGNCWSGAYLLRRGLFMPWELPAILNPDLVREGWTRLAPLAQLETTAIDLKSTHARVVTLELACYMRHQLLRDADWAGMAHSLEIRVPFVDIDLFKHLAPLLIQTAPPRKQDLANAAPTALPEAVVQREKKGFTVPMPDWRVQSFDSRTRPERGPRAWAREVYARFADSTALTAWRARRQRPSANVQSRKALVLVTDAFGGFGGIAKFNRDFLSALAAHSSLAEVIAVPRIMPVPSEPLPSKLAYRYDALGSKRQFMRVLGSAARSLRSCRPKPIIICGHVRLLPAAFAAQRICGGRIHLVIHGIDAWRRSRNPLLNRCARRIDGFISVSQVTTRRFTQWSGLRADQGRLLPNCVDLDQFRPGPKSHALIDRYQLYGRRVLLTLGRLASAERSKGFDEVLQVLPELALEMPEVFYLIVGDGPDRPRLEAKAAQLGVAGRVHFTGRITEAEKADHYRLADLFVMPSSGEGFGIVFLEALACGVPVIGSIADGSEETLLHGRLGQLVNPRDPVEIRSAIVHALRHPQKPNRSGDPGVGYFSADNFRRRAREIIDDLLLESALLES